MLTLQNFLPPWVGIIAVAALIYALRQARGRSIGLVLARFLASMVTVTAFIGLAMALGALLCELALGRTNLAVPLILASALSGAACLVMFPLTVRLHGPRRETPADPWPPAT